MRGKEKKRTEGEERKKGGSGRLHSWKGAILTRDTRGDLIHRPHVPHREAHAARRHTRSRLKKSDSREAEAPPWKKEKKTVTQARQKVLALVEYGRRKGPSRKRKHTWEKDGTVPGT